MPHSVARMTGLSVIVMMSACGGASEPAIGANTLNTLFEREWQWRLEDWPLLATSIGDPRYDDRLPDVSLTAYARRTERTDAFLKELAAIDRSSLAPAERINYDMFKLQVDERRESFRFDEHLLPLNADSGFHTEFALLAQQMPFATAADYDKYLARLRAFPRYMDDSIALMREGLRKGMTIPRASLAGIESSITPLVPDNPEASALWAPFSHIPPALDAAARNRLQADGRTAIAEAVTPAYRRFLTFMTNEYLPGARETLAASALPNGEAYYGFLVRKFTTLPLTHAQVHQTGLEQVAAIRKEMDEAMRKTGFSGTFATFQNFLRTDPRFYPQSADALLKEASFIAKRMDGNFPASSAACRASRMA